MMTTESGNQTPRAAKLALAGAAAILIASLAYAALRDKPPKPQEDPAANTQAPVTIEALQDRVKASPNDPRAWAALGEAQYGRSEFAAAATAYERAVALDPRGSGYWSALGEARVMASERDPMPAPALEAFRKALAIDPKDPRARYFAAVSRDLSGDHKGALDDWFALLADTPPGASWEKDLRRTIAQVGRINKIDVASRLAKISPPVPAPAPGLPGPNADQVKAAAALTPSQQLDMGRNMVASLEARLQADPNNLDGWLMLIRSRMVLGEPAKAQAALEAAVAANPGEKAELERQARELGVP